MTCGIKLEARRNADFRVTFTPASRKFTFSGMVPLFSLRLGDVVLLQVGPSATPNGSNFVVVGDSVVLTIEKADMALLDSAAPDTSSEVLFFDVTLTDGSGFENWLTGGPFILLGLNDVTCGGCNSTIEASLNGACVQVNIDGGNLAAGSNIAFGELNQAVSEAQAAATDAEAAQEDARGYSVVSQFYANNAAASAAEAASFAGGINKGEWDADTNSPPISSGVGVNGEFYTVSVPGATDIDGVTDWRVGDVIRFDQTVWVKNPPLFKRQATDAVVRPTYLKMGDRISIRDWLAPGDDDGVTQCAIQFQRALNEISAAGSAGELWIDAPAVGYNIQSPLSYTGQVPIKIIGGTPMSGFPTGPFAQTNILYTGGPTHPGQACFTFQTNGGNNNPLRGVELHNLFIREPSAALSARGSGVCGVMLKGVTRGNIVNVSTYGFARGFDLDDNPANGDSSRVRCANINFYGLCVQNAAEDRVRVAGSAEIIFYSPTLSGTPRPGYRSDLLIQRGTRGGRPDHIHAYSGTMIGPAENNLRVETGLFNIIQGVACEGGLNANVFATTDQAPSNDIALTLRDLNIDGARMYAIDVLGDMRVTIDNPRTQQLNTSEGGGTVPAIRIRGHASTANVQLGSEVRGGVITYTGPSGVLIENAALVSVIGGTYRDRDQTNAPCIQTGAGTTRCDVVLPKLIGSTGAADLTGGTEHTRLDNSGLSIRGGPWERDLPVIAGTLDGSGVATPAHGVGSAAKITEARAYSINGSGARVPLPVEYWDGTGVRLNGGGVAAARAFELYVTRVP